MNTIFLNYTEQYAVKDVAMMQQHSFNCLAAATLHVLVYCFEDQQMEQYSRK